jgi:mono/diheme cytochrome c family protein
LEVQVSRYKATTMPILALTIKTAVMISILGGALTLGASAQQPSSVGRGQFVAAEKCGGCHAVDGKIKPGAAPSFRAIAAQPNFTSERLKDIIVTPRHPMPATPLGSRELDDIVAYIRSLR